MQVRYFSVHIRYSIGAALGDVASNITVLKTTGSM